jgi:hypothetical protein
MSEKILCFKRFNFVKKILLCQSKSHLRVLLSRFIFQSYFESGALTLVGTSLDDVSERHLKSLEPVIHKFVRPAMALESQVIILKALTGCKTSYLRLTNVKLYEKVNLLQNFLLFLTKRVIVFQVVHPDLGYKGYVDCVTQFVNGNEKR